MAEVIVMPQQGNSVEEVVLNTWRVKPGDSVATGDVICEVETDKTTMDVEATADGTVLAVLADEGEEVAVMTPILVVGKPGEAVPDDLVAASTSGTPQAAGTPDQVGTEAPASAPPASATAAAPGAPSVHTGERSAYGKVRVSPRARGRARELGIDPSQLSGSGPGGRVLVRDVEAASSSGKTGAPLAAAASTRSGAPAAAPATAPGAAAQTTGAAAASLAPATTRFVEEPVRGIRATIARRMLSSLQETAQLTLTSWADARALQAYRARLKEAEAGGEVGPISINDMILYATARVITEFPAVNAHFTGDTIRTFDGVDLGFAVDTDRGLLVPTIPNAHLRSLADIAAEARVLGGRARGGQAGPADLAPASFTVTNLGALGIEAFTPVLNPPQVAILGVGAIALKAVADPAAPGGVAHIPHISLSLTINHQALDGAPGAHFLRRLSQALASFDVLLAG